MASVGFLYNKTANISLAVDGAAGNSDTVSTDLFQTDYIAWINITNVVGAAFSMTASFYQSIDGINWFKIGNLSTPAAGTTFTTNTVAQYAKANTTGTGPYLKISWTLAGAGSGCTVQYYISYDKRR